MKHSDRVFFTALAMAISVRLVQPAAITLSDPQEGPSPTAPWIAAAQISRFAPCDAVEALARQVNESALAPNRKRPLIASLAAACASFERDHVESGVNQLEAFENKVKAQVTRVDAGLAETWIRAAQAIIDVVTKPWPDLEADMVWIPPGAFIMGSPTNEALRKEHETQHPVMISRGFWMGKYEVTQGQYLDVVGNNPSYFSGVNLPVEMVTWFDATNYCGLLTERERLAGRLPEGYLYRLPTEAEWEYACRAGTRTAFHYGDALRSGMANFGGPAEYDASVGTIRNPDGVFLGRTTEVGGYEPNEWGLYDMHGNVWEWCQDGYGPYPVGPVTDPTGPEVSALRILRGGGWLSGGSECRSAFRRGNFPQTRIYFYGFRVVVAAGQP